ncbi:MAG: 50S ribosomal protein L11 methyltransferase [Gammaproteobacteria bacterium]|nr:50S ribosomal protein L11 methyltransferase [Gammaproteobacteria bacterium]
MTWKQATFVVDQSEVEKLTGLLEAFLAAAVTTENAGDDEFYEVAFPGIPDWEKVRVTALFDERIELGPIVDFIHNQYPDQEIPTAINRLVEQDWERVWLSSFTPIEVGQELWVCPTWCEPVEPTSRNIFLDPGLAFGTGTHATTFMCLTWLSSQNLSEQKILDYGSGSGILAIAALMCGGMHADAVDIDPLAVNACFENAERNHLSSKLEAYLPNQLPSEHFYSYDLVIANILAEVIIELRDTLLLHLKPGGTLLLTGILESQVDRVLRHYGSDFEVELNQQDQWALLVLKSKSVK